ncbi:MAG: Clp protease/crotonase-like domain-containing protein, partial [Planctomycetota bacterium]
MVKYLISMLAVLFFFSNCFADTFTHRQSGKSFNGYATQIKRQNKTQVRIVNKKRPQYLDLGDYEIHYNRLGRKNKVFTLSIKDSVDLIFEAEAFEDAIISTANQGPLFILIEIDTPGGRIDLTKRICGAITQIDNCRTVAFVNGGKFGGAYSTGAAIALACDELYMADNTTIGGETLVSPSPSDITNVRRRRVRTSRIPYGRSTIEKPIIPSRPDDDASTLTAYIAALAEQNNRPAVIAKAMVDTNIEALEVTEDGKTLFVEGWNKKANHTLVRTWSQEGSLLTLTAAEAVQCKITDKIISSARELLAALDAAKAGFVRNNDVERAKRQFAKINRDFNEVSGAITYLTRRSEELRRELSLLEGRSRWYGYGS